MNVFVVSTWLQHRVLAPDKHGVHFPVLEGTLNFITLFLLKAVIGCSWNNSHRFLLVWRMFQLLGTTDVRSGKNRLYVNINDYILISIFNVALMTLDSDE